MINVTGMKAMLFIMVVLVCMVDAYALPDPTMPYEYDVVPEVIEVEVPEESIEWKLNGIRIRGDNRTAILNGKVIREGDQIEGVKVLTIKPTSVVLESENKHLVVKLLDAKVKRPATSGAN